MQFFLLILAKQVIHKYSLIEVNFVYRVSFYSIICIILSKTTNHLCIINRFFVIIIIIAGLQVMTLYMLKSFKKNVVQILTVVEFY